MNKLQSGQDRYLVRLVAGTLLLILVVMALAVLVTYEDRLEHDRRAHTTVHNLSLLLEREIGAEISRIDLVLRMVAEEAEDELASKRALDPGFNAFLARQEKHLPEISSLRVTDAHGQVRFGKGVVPGAVDLSDREFFIRHRGHDQAGLVISTPVLARISKEWSIPLARRINRPNGDFAGVVYANIPVSHFTRKFAELRLGASGVVALRSAGHISMARYPEQLEGGGVPGQFALSDQLRRLPHDNPDSVTYVAPSPSDHIERVFGYSRLKNYPLYVVVGIATQDYLSEWEQDTAQTFGVLLLFVVGSIVFAWLLARAWKRLREIEKRLSLALEGSGFGVFDWNLHNGHIETTTRGKQILGYDDDEVADHVDAWIKLIHPEDLAHARQSAKDHFRHRTQRFGVELRMRGKTGEWKWCHLRGVVVQRASDGRPLRMVGTYIDISERRHREEELKLSAAVFRMANEAMVITSPDNRIISVNPAFTVITGYTPDDVIGRNPSLLSAKTHSRAFYEEMWHSLIQTGGWSGEVLNRKKSGEVYVEWLSIRRVTDDSGHLTHHVAVFSDITERKAAEKRIRHLALHDALTDLPNRTLLTERTEQALLRAQRNKSNVGLIYFDLDKFKPINDTYGHEIGDQLLKTTAQRVQGCVRASDTVARLGGDEFVILLQEVQGAQEALAVANKVLGELERPFKIAGHSLAISGSLGVAIYPDHGLDEVALTRNADAAMYQAKREGRGRVTLYRPDL